jgi:hypothetical protein
MKHLITTTLVLFSFFAVGGGYYSPSIDQYDPVTGLYFKSVKLEKESSFLSSSDEAIVNIFIYDPSKDSGYYLFPENHEKQIVALSFETALKDGVVEFNNSYSSPVKNNTGIIDRQPKPTMLVVTRDSKKQTDTFFTANKITGNPKEIGKIHSKSNWHIDVKNSKIRVVRQVGNKIEMESLAW